MRYEDMTQLIGNTPAVRVRSKNQHRSIWVKLEGQNPTGSVKDRACISNIRDAMASGHLKPGMTLLDASSGNMACALAYWGHVFGYPVTVVCSSKLTKDKEAFIRYFGAELIIIGTFTIEGNAYCRDVLMKQNPEKYCFLDQLHNQANPAGSYSTLGPEILADFPDLTAVVGSLGSGGSLLGTAKYLKEKRPEIISVAVQSQIGTKLPGTGSFDEGDYITPFISEGYDRKIFQHTYKVTLEEAKLGTATLAKNGIFVGFQTGGVYRAAEAMAEELGLSGDIVIISGDSGWKNMHNLVQG